MRGVHSLSKCIPIIFYFITLRNKTGYSTFKILINKYFDFSVGNDILHALTSYTNLRLRIEMEDFKNVNGYAEYAEFYVAGETDSYQLTVIGYSGDAGLICYC